MPIHTDFRQGQRVRVMFKRKMQKEHVVGRFVSSGRACICIDQPEEDGVKKISLKDIRAVTIERGNHR